MSGIGHWTALTAVNINAGYTPAGTYVWTDGTSVVHLHGMTLDSSCSWAHTEQLTSTIYSKACSTPALLPGHPGLVGIGAEINPRWPGKEASSTQIVHLFINIYGSNCLSWAHHGGSYYICILKVIYELIPNFQVWTFNKILGNPFPILHHIK